MTATDDTEATHVWLAYLDVSLNGYKVKSLETRLEALEAPVSLSWRVDIGANYIDIRTRYVHDPVCIELDKP